MKAKKILGYVILISLYLLMGWIAYLTFQDKELLKVIFGDMWPISGVFAGAFLGLTLAGIVIVGIELIDKN